MDEKFRRYYSRKTVTQTLTKNPTSSTIFLDKSQENEEILLDDSSCLSKRLLRINAHLKNWTKKISSISSTDSKEKIYVLCKQSNEKEFSAFDYT